MAQATAPILDSTQATVLCGPPEKQRRAVPRATAAVTAKLRCYLAGASAGGASPGAAGLLPVVAAPSRDLPEGSPK